MVRARGPWFLLLALVALAAAFAVFFATSSSLADVPAQNPAHSEGRGFVYTPDDTYPDFPPKDLDSSAGLGPLTVIGADERVQITDTASYPWRAVTWLFLYDQFGLEGTCTGTFVGPDVVLTAAHCLYDPVSGWFTDVGVVPGANGLVEPYGHQFGANWWVPDGWISSGGNELFDWGLIKMPSSMLGNTVGWFTIGDMTTTTLSRSDFAPAVVGYPGDKPLGTMWFGFKNSFFAVDQFTLTHDIDTFPGQSGSAIFSADLDSTYLGFIVGIHTSGGTNHNYGSRIDDELLIDLLVGCNVMGCSISSFVESLATPSPTPSPSPTHTPSPTPTHAPSPSPTPTPSPTHTPTQTPTHTPTPTPTHTPTSTPVQGTTRRWADVDCSGGVSIGDAQKIARSLIRLLVTLPPACPEIGSTVIADGTTRYDGDIDCNESVSIGDAQKLARDTIGLPVTQPDGCPQPLDLVSIS